MKTIFRLFVLQGFLLVIPSISSFSLPVNIGDYYGGGIVFYIDGTGQHALIAAASDQSAGAQWGCSGTSIPGTSTAIGTGLANTTDIINVCSDAGIAARICQALVLNGYNDWFLPSKDELNQMYIQRNVIGGFTSGYYWSSSDDCQTAAWAQYFTSGVQDGYGKTHTFYVRPIRAVCFLPDTPTTGTNIPSPTQIVWNWNTISNADGYKWNTTNSYITATNMGTATTKTETGLTCNTAYTSYVWAYNSCGNSTPVTLSQTTSLNALAAPTAGINVPSPTQIVWNWNTVSNATGYKWNNTNNYATATDMGTGTSATETGLTCNTAYTSYAWAYNSCGNSTPVTLSQTTSQNPPTAPTAGINVPSSTQIVWIWNTVSGATGYKWNNTNDYSSATNMGTATTKTETGLNPNTLYTRYVWAYNNCGNSTATTLSQTTLPSSFYIGENYEGGIIFYIDGTGQHGLIAAASDQSTGTDWGCSGTIIGGTGTGIGTGQANTTRIINGCSDAGTAARICHDLVLNGYSDWFLPSQGELNQMFIQQLFIGGFGTNNYYWSSSEEDDFNAWDQAFIDGHQYSGDKISFLQQVRAIRAF